MKKPWLLILLSALVGFGAAWKVNDHRFGADASFGPFAMDGEVTPDTVKQHLDRLVPKSQHARAELIGMPHHDFGVMSPGSEGEHIFLVKNVGSEDLKLQLGHSTCKCTFGELEDDSIAPGKEAEITLKWGVKVGIGDTFTQTAEVLTNDPTRQSIVFTIKGKVVQDIDIMPKTWTFEASTGEAFQFDGRIFNFFPNDIELTNLRLTSDSMEELTEFTVEEFTPTEGNSGYRNGARQGFRITAKVQPGLRQGNLAPRLIVGFHLFDENGEKVLSETGSDERYITVPVTGKLVGSLSMIPTSKLAAEESGGYIYDFGRVGRSDKLTAKMFVVLKGNERDNTSLRIGEISPEGVVKATLGEPIWRPGAESKLFPLELELVPGSELIERSGKNEEDYGLLWIESDNPKVTKMHIGLKFSLEGR